MIAEVFTPLQTTLVWFAGLMSTAVVVALLIYGLSPKGKPDKDSYYRQDWWDFGRGRALLALGIGLAVSIFVCLMVWWSVAAGRNTCLQNWGDRAVWSTSAGCSVLLDDGQVVPEDRVKGREVIDVGGINAPANPGV